MSLGETIYRLRTERNMSQGDLADALEVSRQSISKWETGGSVPELDKLTKMGELFGVSMDELILGKRAEKEAPPVAAVAAPVAAPRNEGPNRKTVGLVLLSLGVVVWLVLTVMGGFGTGLMFASPFILCSVVCLAFKKNTGLWCAWTVFCTVNMYLRYATGITWRLTLWTLNYEPSMNYTRLAFAWLEVACIVALLVITVLRLRKTPLAVNRKNVTLVIALWVLFGLTWIRLSFDPLSTLGNLYYYLSDWVQFILSAVALTYTVRLIRTWRGKEN